MKGKRTAHKALYAYYKDSWIFTSRRYANSKQEAEDILQEGVLQIYKDLGQYDFKKSNFKTWSNRVLAHAALKFLKKNSFQKLFVELDATESDFRFDDQLMSHISANEILSYIQELPTGYKLVFNLFAIEEYTHKEIAEQLNISIGTSKSQLFKARKMLKEIIEKSYING